MTEPPQPLALLLKSNCLNFIFKRNSVWVPRTFGYLAENYSFKSGPDEIDSHLISEAEPEDFAVDLSDYVFP